MAADFTQFPIETATITERVASNPATLPLAGTEALLLDQGGTTKGATAAAIAATLPNATTTVAGKMSAGDKTKLNNIASNATANASDAELRDRATHTGEQAISTVTGLQTALDGKEAAGAAASAQSAAISAAATDATTKADAAQSAAIAAAIAAFNTRLDEFRDARTFWVSKRIGASDSNNGTSPSEPFLTIGAAVAAANAFRVANPGEFAAIEIGPGTYVEAALPMRLRPNILVRSLKQRSVRIKPAAGQEFNSFFAVDSGNMICDITFAGHQAINTSPTTSTVGTRAWVVQFNEQANGGLGPILSASPYIKDCLSLTAEEDAGEAGSTSTGDCGGGVEVDGAKVHPASPIRSMVVYGFTQQNLGGPGAVIKNDGYAELVSFFGLFGTWHVRCETGGQATMSGGGCSEFGIYGLMADGYSPTALFTGSLRVAALEAALEVDVVSMTANRLGTKSRPASGQVMLLGGSGYVVQSSTPINASGVPVAEGAAGQAGYRVSFFNPTGLGLAANVAQGATADFRLRSQISAGCHSANYVGSGTNYNALPWNGGVPVRANEAVETNFGRVFGLIVNDVGDLRTPSNAFKVDGTTGSVTISTDEFDLSGLNAVGPFSRNGGASTVGVQLQEVSNDTSLIASTGVPDGNTAPTQVAVKTYTDNKFLQGLTATADGPISISDTSTVDGQGFQTRNRNISISETPSFAGLTITDIEPVAIPHIHGSIAGNFYIHVRNTSGGTLPAGTAVYVTGSVGDTDRLQVAACDPADPLKMPAVAVLEVALANNGNGDAIILGELRPANTNGLALGAPLYVGVGGALTATVPTSGIVQSVATVARVNVATGTLVIHIGDELGTAALRSVGTVAGTVAAGDDSRFSAVVTTSAAGLQPASGYGTITYAAQVTIDVAARDRQINTISLTGALELLSSNLANGREVRLRLVCDGTERTLTFPTDWKFVGTKPASIAASKVAMLTLAAFGTTNADVVAAYAVQS